VATVFVRDVAEEHLHYLFSGQEIGIAIKHLFPKATAERFSRRRGFTASYSNRNPIPTREESNFATGAIH
jgi:hypothetical protein